MNHRTTIPACLLALVISGAVAETVSIGTNNVPLVFSSTEMRAFETNRVAQAFSDYFACGDSVEAFFGVSPGSLPPGESAQLDPSEQEGGLPVEAAADVVYQDSPDERIVVGETALTWILGQFDLAEPLTNVWQQTDSLFAELASGLITNDLARCSDTFVMDGHVVTNADSDLEMVHGIETFWSGIRFHPPTVFGLRRGRLTADGPEFVGLHCRYSETHQPSWSRPSCLLVFLEGRWRIVLQ